MTFLNIIFRSRFHEGSNAFRAEDGHEIELLIDEACETQFGVVVLTRSIVPRWDALPPIACNRRAT